MARPARILSSEVLPDASWMEETVSAADCYRLTWSAWSKGKREDITAAKEESPLGGISATNQLSSCSTDFAFEAFRN